MEFVLVLPLLFLLVLAIAEIAVVARTSLQLSAAVREGARVAATSPDPDRAIEATRRALGPELAKRTRITVLRPPVVGQPARVTVSVDHMVLAALGGFRVPLESSTEMRVEG
ncbi:MAG: pilus assembly protein [bacterium]|nr:pilus assembly protein [bacterium]MCY3579395.1 pilus assembly protein [bacterium]MCY3652346.1 pilus assembly protein [bacterium]MDE0642562.1 pilus assembly protein [bacterium]